MENGCRFYDTFDWNRIYTSILSAKLYALKGAKTIDKTTIVKALLEEFFLVNPDPVPEPNSISEKVSTVLKATLDLMVKNLCGYDDLEKVVNKIGYTFEDFEIFSQM